MGALGFLKNLVGGGKHDRDAKTKTTTATATTTETREDEGDADAVVAEVARQRMLALAAAARTEDLRPPTAASLKSGHAIGKGASFGSHVCV